MAGEVEEAVGCRGCADLLGDGGACGERWAKDGGDVDYGDFGGESVTEGGREDGAGDGAVAGGEPEGCCGGRGRRRGH